MRCGQQAGRKALTDWVRDAVGHVPGSQNLGREFTSDFAVAGGNGGVKHTRGLPCCVSLRVCVCEYVCACVSLCVSVCICVKLMLLRSLQQLPSVRCLIIRLPVCHESRGISEEQGGDGFRAPRWRQSWFRFLKSS